jgi:hypothetical protein
VATVLRLLALADIDDVQRVPSLKEAARLVRYFECTYVVKDASSAAELRGVMLRAGEDVAKYSGVFEQLQKGFQKVSEAARGNANLPSLRPGGKSTNVKNQLHAGASPVPCLTACGVAALALTALPAGSHMAL